MIKANSRISLFLTKIDKLINFLIKENIYLKNPSQPDIRQGKF